VNLNVFRLTLAASRIPAKQIIVFKNLANWMEVNELKEIVLTSKRYAHCSCFVFTYSVSITTAPATSVYTISKELKISTLRPDCTPNNAPITRGCVFPPDDMRPRVAWSEMLMMTRGCREMFKALPPSFSITVPAAGDFSFFSIRVVYSFRLGQGLPLSSFLRLTNNKQSNYSSLKRGFCGSLALRRRQTPKKQRAKSADRSKQKGIPCCTQYRTARHGRCVCCFHSLVNFCWLRPGTVPFEGFPWVFFVVVIHCCCIGHHFGQLNHRPLLSGTKQKEQI